MTPTIFTKIVFKACTILKRKDWRWKLKQKFPVLFFLPHMRRVEFQLFKKTMAAPKMVLEYGSGGSTIYMLSKGKTVFSVESNEAFYKYMNTISLVKKALNQKLFFFFANLGNTNEWGRPMANGEQQSSANYYASVWDRIDPSLCKVDAVFIDGRYRVACCLYTVFKLLRFEWTDTKVVIHDFWRRQHYHVVLEFLDEVASAKDLAVFQIKRNVNTAKLRAIIEQHELAAA